MPADDSGRLDDHERLTPTTPQTGEENPETAIQPGESRFSSGSRKNTQLVPEADVFQNKGMSRLE